MLLFSRRLSQISFACCCFSSAEHKDKTPACRLFVFLYLCLFFFFICSFHLWFISFWDIRSKPQFQKIQPPFFFLIFNHFLNAYCSFFSTRPPSFLSFLLILSHYLSLPLSTKIENSVKLSLAVPCSLLAAEHFHASPYIALFNRCNKTS